MRAEIISIGTELLLGQILNTNSRFLSEELASFGFDLYYQTTIGDNRKRLLAALDLASQRSDLIVISGGLGPTKDDITRETLAEFLGKALYKDEVLALNNKQANIIEGAAILANNYGTAPGQFISSNDKFYIILPGPPRELMPMFLNEASGHIRKLLGADGDIIYTEELSFFGIGESQLEKSIIDLINNQSNPTIVTLIGDNLVRVRLTAKAGNVTAAKNLINPIADEVIKRNEIYYFTNEKKSLIDHVHAELIKQNLTISVAESCTGGAMSSKLTELAGSSSFFLEGVTVYSNEAKVRLGLDSSILDIHGAVSPEVARDLARLIRERANSDIGIGITGIAGPGGGSEEKAVGLVYFHINYGGRSYSHKLELKGDRSRIVSMTVASVLFTLQKLIANISK